MKNKLKERLGFISSVACLAFSAVAPVVGVGVTLFERAHDVAQVKAAYDDNSIGNLAGSTWICDRDIDIRYDFNMFMSIDYRIPDGYISTSFVSDIGDSNELVDTSISYVVNQAFGRVFSYERRGSLGVSSFVSPYIKKGTIFHFYQSPTDAASISNPDNREYIYPAFMSDFLYPFFSCIGISDATSPDFDVVSYENNVDTFTFIDASKLDQTVDVGYVTSYFYTLFDGPAPVDYFVFGDVFPDDWIDDDYACVFAPYSVSFYNMAEPELKSVSLVLLVYESDEFPNWIYGLPFYWSVYLDYLYSFAPSFVAVPNRSIDSFMIDDLSSPDLAIEVDLVDSVPSVDFLGFSDYRYYFGNWVSVYSYSFKSVYYYGQNIYANYLSSQGDNFSTGYAQGYQNGKDDGFDAGKRAGQQEGYDDGYAVGFRNGKVAGEQNAANIPTTITGLFGAIANIPFQVLNGTADLAVWNVPIIIVIFSLLMLTLIFWVLKKIL